MYGLDLFSGIGGITKALDGYVKPITYCENDRYAQAVLLSRMCEGLLPVAPVWDDVRTLRGSMLPVRPDIIYGGFPCQDISVAGKQVGLGGERSGLFFEIMRLARETGAEWIFLENVPNIRTKGLGRVLEELDIFGYDCRWGLLSAADVGANHKRERWFLLAHANNSRLEGWNSRELQERASKQSFGASSPLPHAERNGLSGKSLRGARQEMEKRIMADTERSERRPITQGRHEPNGNNPGREEASSGIGKRSQDVADASCELLERGGGAWHGRPEPTDGSWWAIEPNVGRVAHGVPSRVDRLRALGNAVVPAQAREAFERLMGLK